MSQPYIRRADHQGGRPVRILTPPPSPPDPPKFSNLSLSNLRFWGKVVAPQAPKNFFRPPLRPTVGGAPPPSGPLPPLQTEVTIGGKNEI